MRKLALVTIVGARAQAAAPQGIAQRGTGSVGAPSVRQLDTLPQMSPEERHPQPLAPRVPDPEAVAARKAEAARLRFKVTPASPAQAPAPPHGAASPQ